MSIKKPLPKWRASTLREMSLPELLRLKRALEGSEGMIVDGSIYDSVLNTIWRRGSRGISSWPTDTLENGLRVVRFCTKSAEDLGPNDPEHRPARRMQPLGRVASSQTLGDVAGSWSGAWYECSCGRRDGDASDTQRATGRTWRVPGEPGGWLRSDEAAAVLHLRDVKPGMYLVCRAAKGIDDLGHALSHAYPGSPPGEGTMRATFQCICHCSSYDYEVKQIPVGGGAS